MSQEREIRDDDLRDVAQNDEQAQRLHKALRTLATNPNVGGPLQQMAKEVLSGRIGMRDAIQTESYMDALGARMTEIRRAAENETPKEREAKREQVDRWQQAQQAEDDRERAERDGPSRRVHGTDRHRPRGHRP